MHVFSSAITPIVISQILSNPVSNKSGASIITGLDFEISSAFSLIFPPTYFVVNLSIFSFLDLSENIISASFFLSISKFSSNISFPKISTTFS